MGQGLDRCCTEPRSALAFQMGPAVPVTENVNSHGRDNWGAMRGRGGSSSLMPGNRQHSPSFEVSTSVTTQDSNFEMSFEACSDQHNVVTPLQPVFLAGACESLQASQADIALAFQPSWPQVPAAADLERRAHSRLQPSLTELSSPRFADDGIATSCHNKTAMTLGGDGMTLMCDEEVVEEDKCQRHVSTLSQWYEDASPGLNILPNNVNVSLTSEDEEAPTLLLSLEAKSGAHWYGDSLSDVSTHGVLSGTPGSDSESCITSGKHNCRGLERETIVETTVDASPVYQSNQVVSAATDEVRTLFAKTEGAWHERTLHAVLDCSLPPEYSNQRAQDAVSQKSTGTEVFFLFDPSAIEHNYPLWL